AEHYLHRVSHHRSNGAAPRNENPLEHFCHSPGENKKALPQRQGFWCAQNLPPHSCLSVGVISPKGGSSGDSIPFGLSNFQLAVTRSQGVIACVRSTFRFSANHPSSSPQPVAREVVSSSSGTLRDPCTRAPHTGRQSSHRWPPSGTSTH